MWKSTRQLFAPSCELLALAQVVFFAFFGTAGPERSNGLSRITSHVNSAPALTAPPLDALELLREVLQSLNLAGQE